MKITLMIFQKKEDHSGQMGYFTPENDVNS